MIFFFDVTALITEHIIATSSVNVNLNKITNKQNIPSDPFPHNNFISLSFSLYFRSLNKSTFDHKLLAKEIWFLFI